jgi:drug/metabolite transporter, DME family
MRTLQTAQPRGLWLVTGAAVIWGTIGVATQAIYQIDSTTSLFINLARMLIATPVLLAACWHVVGRRMFRVQRRDALVMLLTGVFMALSHASYFAAIRYTGVSIATLLTICVAPIVVAGVSVLLKFESLTGRMLMALLCALIGSVLLVGLQSPEDTGDLAIGTLFALIAAVTYASMILCGRFLAADYHPLQVTALTFGVGTLVLLVINLASGIVIVHTAQGWLLVAYLGLVPTALAYWLFQMGLRSVSATSASLVSLLDPLVAALLAWVLFGERLAATGLIGAALLIVGLLLLSTDKKDTKQTA